MKEGVSKLEAVAPIGNIPFRANTTIRQNAPYLQHWLYIAFHTNAILNSLKT